MKKLPVFIAMLLLIGNVVSQTPITLTFQAKDSITQNVLALDSLNVTNLTTACDTTLYDAVSVLSIIALWPVGIGEPDSRISESFVLMQNVPNPFRGSTLVKIYLKNDGELTLAVYDNLGKNLSQYHNSFEKGWHLFGVSTNGARMLFLSVFDNTTTKTIKILSTGPGNEGNRISWHGPSASNPETLKSFPDATGFIFYLGDHLQYTAYADGYHESIINDNPVSSETYTFAMLPVSNPTIPSVSTFSVTNIAQTTATSGGDVIADGGATVTARGVCWGTSPNPTTAGSHTTDGGGTGTFVSYLTGLTPNTPYFIRAYATNSVGTAYGNELTFSTLPNPVLPTVTTATVTNIAQTTATSGGNVTDDGGATVIARGVCWSTSSNPTTAGNHTTDGSGTGAFVSYLTGLTPNTPYYIRAYATNSVGTTYGNELSFTTPWGCGASIIINHVAGNVAPVTKTVTYGTVTNIPGEITKCWITSNLGADHQATAVDDATEASAGWYWQFNLKQGYKHDGTTRTPNTPYATSIVENLDWQAANDPCALELGSGWRLPTSTEWTNVDASGNWIDWNGPWNSDLKLHAAGYLYGTGGMLYNRGEYGIYWSSAQMDTSQGYTLAFVSSICHVTPTGKADGHSIRCIKD